MINKQTTLGRNPEQLGIKDAVHVAIISVQAGRPIKKGEKVEIKDNYVAYPTSDRSRAFGVADPFSKTPNSTIRTGQTFWALAFPSEVQSVSHIWNNAKIDKISDKVISQNEMKNQVIDSVAKEVGVSYNFLMGAAEEFMETNRPVEVESKKSLDEDSLEELRWDFWSEWAGEVGHHFENLGSECCPEYDYPEFPIRITNLKQ